MRDVVAALRWMTVLPLPACDASGAMGRAVPWLPATGLPVGLAVVLAAMFGSQYDSWLGALLAVVVWLGITGFLHADGLADLMDALGASHSNRERFLSVLKDPHIGSFGVMSLILLVVAKLILLKLLIDAQLWWGLLLIPIWARVGLLFWLQLPALTDGFAAAIRSAASIDQAWIWGVVLFLLTLFGETHLLWLAGGVLAAWQLFLQQRLQGMNGDVLGAGIECCEVGLLLLLLI